MTVHTTITAEQLLTMGDIGRCELVDGEIIKMAPAGAQHGNYSNQFAWRITSHVIANDLGIVYGAETGFIIARNPDTVRAPDVAFIRKTRVPTEEVPGFFPGPPDMLVEVVSPDDRRSEVVAKARQWVASGAASVWIVDPRTRTVEVHRANSPPVLFQRGDTITDEPTLPGFVLKLSDVFG